MQKLEVGKQYPGKMMNGVYLDYDDGFTLYLFLPNLNEKEITSIRTGSYRFALAEVSGILNFLYEFKHGMKLSDSPFHFGLYTDGRIDNLPEVSDDPEGLPLTVIAVDTTTGVLQAVRLIGLGTRFSKKMISICKEQDAVGINQIDYLNKVSSVQSRYQAKDLLKFSSVICKG